MHITVTDVITEFLFDCRRLCLSWWHFLCNPCLLGYYFIFRLELQCCDQAFFTTSYFQIRCNEW